MTRDPPLETWEAGQVASAPRVVVLRRNARTSAALLAAFTDAEAESRVPFALAEGSPALLYYEHGEELERMDRPRASDVAPFVAAVDALQEEDVPQALRRKTRNRLARGLSARGS